MYMLMNVTVDEMAQEHSITQARRNLPRLIREAELGKTVRLTRRGRPVAVLVGHRSFERMVTGRRSFVEAYEEFKKTVDLADLDFDPAEFLEGTRDESPSRDFRL